MEIQLPFFIELVCGFLPFIQAHRLRRNVFFPLPGMAFVINHRLESPDKHDAFGVVQWLFWSRKKALHEFAKGRDIGTADVQIGYLLEELPKYKAVWPEVLNATDIQTPSDLLMLKYEKPGTVTEQAKEKRRKYAQSFYDKYAQNPPVIKGRLLKTKVDRVLVRAGNGLEYSPVARIEKKDTCFPVIASSDNNWHAIAFGDDRVSWVSGNYVDILEG